ncbi:MAG: hypothetical protein Q9227_003279 [Pyrenula ochraceoflavens]
MAEIKCVVLRIRLLAGRGSIYTTTGPFKGIGDLLLNRLARDLQAIGVVKRESEVACRLVHHVYPSVDEANRVDIQYSWIGGKLINLLDRPALDLTIHLPEMLRI